MLGLMTGWLIFWSAGKALSTAVARRFGGALLRAGGGKFTDPAAFVYHRAQDALILLTTFMAAALLVVVLNRWLRRYSWFRRTSGLGLGVLAFIILNGWVELATHTALFWLPFYSSVHIENYVQFQIKKNLLREHATPQSIVLVGNSQTGFAIDETVLNEELGPGRWTTEMQQPGSNGFDTLLLVRDLRSVQIDYTITYISEIFVYGQENGVAPTKFFYWRDLAWVWEHHAWSQFPPGCLRTGLISQLLPLFRLGDPIAHRLLGGGLAGLPQQRFDAALNARTPDEASARLLKIEIANFEKSGFETAVSELAVRNAKAIVIAGGIRPDLHAKIDADVLADIAAWLASLKERWPQNVEIIPETAFFQATADDFRDDVHLSQPASERFSHALARYLRQNRLLEE